VTAIDLLMGENGATRAPVVIDLQRSIDYIAY